MNFNDIVNEALTTDMDAIKGQIKALEVNLAEKDKIIADKDKAIQELKARMTKSAVPKLAQPKVGIGTRRDIRTPVNRTTSQI